MTSFPKFFPVKIYGSILQVS